MGPAVVLLLVLAGCATAPDALPARAALPVPGPPEGCRASWVIAGPAPRHAPAGGPFRQVPGRLAGMEHGACALLGPDPEGVWRWVLMGFEPGFRGEISCRAAGLRSPVLLVGDPALPAPPGVKVDLSAMDAGEIEAAARGAIPTRAEPCPAPG